MRPDFNGTILYGHARLNANLGKSGMERTVYVKRDMLVMPMVNAKSVLRVQLLLMKNATAPKAMNGLNLNGNVSMFVILMKSGTEKLVFVKMVLPDMVENASHALFIHKLSMKNVFVRRIIFGVIASGHALQHVANGKNGMEVNVDAKLDVEDITTIVSLAQPTPNLLMKNASVTLATNSMKMNGLVLHNVEPINIGMEKFVHAKEIMF